DRLVYRAQRADKEELREKSLKDGHETVLISDDFSRMRVRWSHDGSRLVYLLLRPLDPEHTRMGRSFVVLSVGSGDERILTSSDMTDEVPYDWSADGKWILGNSDRQNLGRRGIALFPVAAAPHAETQMRVITSHPEQNLYQTRFSPDGRWISFIAAKAIEAGISTIYVISAAGGNGSASQRADILTTSHGGRPTAGSSISFRIGRASSMSGASVSLRHRLKP